MKNQAALRATEDLHYIGSLALELANMARQKGLNDLATLLDMATLEAKISGEAANDGKSKQG